MNAKGILNQLMQQSSGKSANSTGDTVDKLLQGLSSKLGGGGGSGKQGDFDMKSLFGGGALGLLIGSKRGRRMGSKAIKYGAIAGVGMLAWKAWQNYQDQTSGSPDAASRGAGEGERVERLEGPAGEQRSLEILKAMIMAARADGHIDQEERAQLTEQISGLGADDELRAWMDEQLQAPLDARALAQEADSPQAAREMYVASLAIIDEQNPMERAWLDQLASELNIDPELAGELERQVAANG